MKKIINQAPIVRYRASVSEILFPDFWNGTFSAESFSYGLTGIGLRPNFLGSAEAGFAA